MHDLTICSWNVNGLRATLKTGDLQGWLAASGPDVVGMQEVKATPDQVDPAAWRELGYREAWHTAERPGYSGALLLFREEPDAVRLGLGLPEFDSEGRVIQADYGDLTVVTAYFPNGGNKGSRLPFKFAFYEAFLTLLADLRERGRRVLFMGDLNVAHREIDVARPAEAIKGTGFLPEEQAWLDRFEREGFVDTFRSLHPDAREAYSYWEPWRERRARNIGWRIDYVWVDQMLIPRIDDAFIRADVMGSDHCPVGVRLRGA
ncbi:MAG: exodeoxyribonuclease III [Dehalococcoidia bacterium]